MFLQFTARDTNDRSFAAPDSGDRSLQIAVLPAMSFDHLLKFVEFGSLAIAAAAVYITIRNNTRQLNAQIFLAYSNRVQAIRGMTTNNVVNREDAAAILFLIFEFYELKRRRFVASAIWSIWDHDMSDLLCSESFQKQWPEIRPRFKNHPHFLRWVDSHGPAI